MDGVASRQEPFPGSREIWLLFAADGRARTIFTQKKLRHDRRWLTDSLDYFGVPHTWLERLSTVRYTPYPMRAQILRGMLAEVEERGDDMQMLFQRRKQYTEFPCFTLLSLSQHGEASAAYNSSLP